ncbi:FeoB-associated Cys-rich membrane protein [Lutibacter sp. TH_r2]|uniref:FeoB-associated Cys-rich membrane protein n=1 Tax=Lutibacter sp. TH_r2 TaxID=3082083 RepID=UPI0029544C60|nr:FeoB-associated Cys-rich membrane protein [Lutibacter sp. TH_r2]MDV7186314.1 FeoB-associated Cys-rich membrane protein [Lutibacter sp. TH_r2]
MANTSTCWNGNFSLYICCRSLFNFKLMQDILVYIALVIAVTFLIKKFFFKSKSTKKGNCGSDCGC